jgi:meso-butanediol dehydrogenase / (S,S)-butanediol dehydrogenase / diacetyl reductase
MFSLQGKAAVVTGAASGIGRATAERYVEAGAAVVLADVDGESVESVAGELAERTPGADVVGVSCDVSDSDAAATTVATAVERFGRLDVLANIAGVLRFEHTHEVTDEEWELVVGVNLTGTFKMTRAALPVMLAQGAGSILNTASSAAYRASPWASAYGASKAGVTGFTRAIAVEYGRQGIRCNCVAPAGVRTPMIGSFRVPDGGDFSLVERIMAFDGELDPTDVANTFLFLASEEADRINGTCVTVDDAMLA